MAVCWFWLPGDDAVKHGFELKLAGWWTWCLGAFGAVSMVTVVALGTDSGGNISSLVCQRQEWKEAGAFGTEVLLVLD